MLLCVKAIKSKNVSWSTYVGIVAVGSFASLVKETFLPVFAASLIYLAIFIYKRHRKEFIDEFIVSVRRASKWSLFFVGLPAIIFAGLLLQHYGQNIIEYGSFRPECSQTIGQDRCEARPSLKRNYELLNTRHLREASEPPQYTLQWFEEMLHTSNFTAAHGLGGRVKLDPLPTINSLVFILVAIGVLALVYSWRSLKKNSAWYFLTFAALTIVISTYIFNTLSYYNLHTVTAVQPRYILSAAPILIVFMVVALNFVMRNSRRLKIASLLVVLALFTQGGGFITHVIQSEDGWYWQNGVVIRANHAAKKVLKPLVILENK